MTVKVKYEVYACLDVPGFKHKQGDMVHREIVDLIDPTPGPFPNSWKEAGENYLRIWNEWNGKQRKNYSWDPNFYEVKYWYI